ncbi:type II CAAX endopeptidase family protein [uncultured Acetobacteroides sp.]|uniref:CPBP family intramembrane glutamic endopeptidase n=1 Tax=uncultured Acetobacteroides sp. TaxID=1760811 RepID=UPI0029F58452|nr:type II CAAX endopeptidase family protein [uncultured Acetobacteroides sp.]
MEKLEKERKASLPLWARVVLYIIAFIASTITLQLVGMLAVGCSISDLESFSNLSTAQFLGVELFGLTGTLLITLLFRRYMDRKTFVSLGFSIAGRGKDILAGLVGAILLFGIGTTLLYLMGQIRFTGFQFDAASFLVSFALFVVVAVNEEMLIRGYILNNLLTRMNKYVALAISASIFGVLHIMNNGMDLLPLVNLILAGILLGSAYIFTRNLWFSISLHLFWNFIQGPVLGYSVSGTHTSSLLKMSSLGDATITGGKFGFEGSIVCTILMVVAIAGVFTYFTRRKGEGEEAIPLQNT